VERLSQDKKTLLLMKGRRLVLKKATRVGPNGVSSDSMTHSQDSMTLFQDSKTLHEDSTTLFRDSKTLHEESMALPSDTAPVSPD
jgi:hypothetical protein